MLFIIISLMLFVSVDMYAADFQDVNPKAEWAAGYLYFDYGAANKIRESLNEDVKDRLDQVNDCAKDRLGDVKELEHQAFDRAELLEVIMRNAVKQLIEDDVNKLGHNVIVDLTQNITKAVIASSLGVGAVIAFYQAAKAAIAIACDHDEQSEKKEYITMYSCAGAATLCAACSLFCYWSIN